MRPQAQVHPADKGIVPVGAARGIEPARIGELVTEGEYRSVSEFVNEAIVMKFEVERIAVDGGLPGPEPFTRFLASPRGRRYLRDVLRALKIE